MKNKLLIRSFIKFINLIKMEMPLKEINNYNLYWEQRNQDGSEGIITRALILEKYFMPGNSLLDIGCGDGEFINYFNKKGLIVEGVDMSDTAVSTCKNKGLKVEKIDISKKDFKLTKNYDYITALCIFEHIQDPEIVIRKFKGHFRKGLFIAVPNIGFLPYRIRLLFGRFPVASIIYHIREHIRFWTVKDFKYWAGKMGFKVIKCISNNDNIISNTAPSLFANNIIYLLREKEKIPQRWY